MPNKPNASYSYFYQALSAIDVPEKEQESMAEDFEQTILLRLVAAAVKKLPKQEGVSIIKLANEAQTKEEKAAVQKRLFTWLKPDEVKKLLKKTADGLFKEFLVHTYKDATKEQEKKLEELFDPDVLKGLA